MTITAVQIAQSWCDDHGVDLGEPCPEFRWSDLIVAAGVYERGVHDPDDPAVRQSYDVFIDCMMSQYDALSKVIDVTLWLGTGEPYDSSVDMVTDINDHGHLWVLPTSVTQRSHPRIPDDHPMLKKVDVGEMGCVNDVFRAVHDVFAHGPGYGFGPRGEYRAWWHHRLMVDPEARMALWCETRGQNAWFNAGEHLHIETGTQRPFAPQKAMTVPAHLI